MAAQSLCSVSDVQTYTGNNAAGLSAVIAALVVQCTSIIQNHCNRNFFAADYVEVRNGRGNDRITLLNAPVNSVAAVQIGAYVVPQAADSQSFGWLNDSESVYIRYGCFDRGISNVQISYNGGYSVIPSDLQQACVELVAFKLAKRNRIDMKSENVAQQTTSYDNSPMPQGVIDALRSYVLPMVSP